MVILSSACHAHMRTEIPQHLCKELGVAEHASNSSAGGRVGVNVGTQDRWIPEAH